MGSPPLRLDRLCVRFGGVRAVEDVSLEIGAGERRALIGPNGAGKTTLFNLISGQLWPSSGRLFLFGTDVTHMAPHRRTALGLARTFQITNLFPNLTVMENLLLAAQALDPSKFSLFRPLYSYRHIVGRAEGLLEQGRLRHLRDEPCRELSYGDQRELEILMALAGSPRLLLLDEPTAGLSPAETLLVVGMIRDLDPGITVLLIEHDLDVAFALARRVTVLHQGQVLAEGTPEEIRRDPRVAEIYLGTGASHA